MQTAIFWPMIAHVALIIVIYSMLAIRRKQAVQSGAARISDFRRNQAEPDTSLFIKNNLANQFELPVLFHVACLALYVTAGAGYLAIVIAWLFTMSRMVHTAIHVTSNRIRYRQPAFIAGFICVILLWLILALHLLRLG